MKTLCSLCIEFEAKSFDQNAESWKRENRLFTSTVLEAGASGQIESIRTHSEVIEQFGLFSAKEISLLILLFLACHVLVAMEWQTLIG